MFGIFCSPKAGGVFDAKVFVWTYDLSLSWTSIVQRVDLSLYTFFPLICFLIYIIIIVVLKLVSCAPKCEIVTENMPASKLCRSGIKTLIVGSG